MEDKKRSKNRLSTSAKVKKENKKVTNKTNSKKKKKAFTLIELLAVIIILGILMIIAIPSVTSYINNSRKSAYVDTAKEIVSGARNKVNEGKLEMFDTGTTYYIPYDYIGTENGAKSPYGDFVYAYVGVVYDGQGYKYYWISVDETGQGVKEVTSYNNLDEDKIVSDIDKTELIDKIEETGIGNRKTVKVLEKNNSGVWSFVTKTENATTIPEEGGGATAASTILATAQTAEQLNQIAGTNIYIFKGGTTNPPANYVKFNCTDPNDTSTCENWRIIGIYNGQMKIIRVNDSGVPAAPKGFTSIKWNTTKPNPGWANSSLKTSLNTKYYNTLSDDAKKMIDENGSWDVGPVAYDAVANAAYTSAIGTKWKGTDTSDPGIGLVASYEFLYATAGGESCLTTSGYSYSSSCGKATNDWMTPDTLLWTLSPNSSSYLVDDSLYLLSAGFVSSETVTLYDRAVPVVFLKSSVKVVSGDGKSPSTAYVLE